MMDAKHLLVYYEFIHKSSLSEELFFENSIVEPTHFKVLRQRTGPRSPVHVQKIARLGYDDR
jgi:hypothetical protein